MGTAPAVQELLADSPADLLRVPRPASADADPHGRELLWNHIWESLNAGSKIVLFAIVTPMMLAAWGTAQFGVFAIANSCVSLMVFLDFGLRTLTRVGLSDPNLSNADRLRLHAVHVAALAISLATGLVVILSLALTGSWHRWLHLPREGDFVIAAVSGVAAATMLVQLLLERIAAAGKLSVIKAAVFAGNVLGFAAVLTCLRFEIDLARTTVTYFVALAFPLLFLLPKGDLNLRGFLAAMRSLSAAELGAAFKQGYWINTITGSWLLQSYGLIFVISALVSPAEAGRFFLYLKLSEFLSVLGASASEPTIAAIAGSATPEQQRARIRTGYSSAVALCLTGAAGYAFFSADLFRLWLGVSLPTPSTGLLLGLLGAMGAFGRMITAATLGLAQPRPAALSSLAGAIVTLLGVGLFYHSHGAEMILATAAASGLFFIPAGKIVSTRMRSGFAAMWMKPLGEFMPSLFLIVAICWSAAHFGTNIAIKAFAAAAAALICLHYIFRDAPRNKTLSCADEYAC
jgi:hypothetical protein